MDISNDAIFSILIFGAVLAVLYLFFISPQQKQKKIEEKFIKMLKIGDAVVTIGGIHGIIADINEQQVLLQGAYGNAQFLVEKQALSSEATKRLYKEPN